MEKPTYTEEEFERAIKKLNLGNEMRKKLLEWESFEPIEAGGSYLDEKLLAEAEQPGPYPYSDSPGMRALREDFTAFAKAYLAEHAEEQ